MPSSSEPGCATTATPTPRKRLQRQLQLPLPGRLCDHAERPGQRNDDRLPQIAANRRAVPNKLNYTTGKEAFLGNVFDAALYFQDDWKVNPFLTCRAACAGRRRIIWRTTVIGGRALHSHMRWTATRRKRPRRCLRGGYGFFYDRFQIGSLMTWSSNNGGAKQPDSDRDQQSDMLQRHQPERSSRSLASAASGTAVTPARSPDFAQLPLALHGAVWKQPGAPGTKTIDAHADLCPLLRRAPDGHARLQCLLSSREHLFYNSTTGPRPNPILGIVRRDYPEAVFKQNQLIVNVNAHFTPNFSVTGFYNLTYANGDTGTASNSYNLSQDYGRSSFVTRRWSS